MYHVFPTRRSAHLFRGLVEHEIVLIGRGIGRTVQLRPMGPDDAADIMAGGEAVGAEIAGEAQQVGELHARIAAYAGDGRAALHIFVGKALEDRKSTRLNSSN